MENLHTQTLSDEIAQFVIKNSDGIYKESERVHIATYADIHMKYGTLMVVRDKGEIVAVCRWNMPEVGHATILDLVVRPDFRHKHLIKTMLLRAKMAMPELETISFQRDKKDMIFETRDIFKKGRFLWQRAAAVAHQQ